MDSKHQIYRPEESNNGLRAEKLTSEDESNELLGDIDFWIQAALQCLRAS